MPNCSGSGCQSASGISCACRCGGACHGIRARLNWAQSKSKPVGKRTEVDNDLVNKFDERIRKTKENIQAHMKCINKSRKKPTREDAKYFFEYCRTVDIVFWLIENYNEINAIDHIAKIIEKECEKILLKYPECYTRLADHFWCDVLAATASVLQEMLQNIDKTSEELEDYLASEIAKKVWQTVYAQRVSARGNRPYTRINNRSTKSRASLDKEAKLPRKMLEHAVKNIVNRLLSPVSSFSHQSLEPIILKLQISAILICSDPYAHKAVWEHCVVPLIVDAVVLRCVDISQEYVNLFKQQWIWKE